MHPAAETAIGARDYILAADGVRVSEDAIGHESRMLDDVGGMADDAGNEDLAVRQFDFPPKLVLVLVPDVAGLDGIGLGLDPEHHVNDVAKRDVCGVRAVPA